MTKVWLQNWCQSQRIEWCQRSNRGNKELTIVFVIKVRTIFATQVRCNGYLGGCGCSIIMTCVIVWHQRRATLYILHAHRKIVSKFMLRVGCELRRNCAERAGGWRKPTNQAQMQGSFFRKITRFGLYEYNYVIVNSKQETANNQQPTQYHTA